MTWNYETPIGAPADAIGGYVYMKDTKGVVVARCRRCHLGFVIRSPNELLDRMVEHQRSGHAGSSRSLTAFDKPERVR